MQTKLDRAKNPKSEPSVGTARSKRTLFPTDNTPVSNSGTIMQQKMQKVASDSPVNTRITQLKAMADQHAEQQSVVHEKIKGPVQLQTNSTVVQRIGIDTNDLAAQVLGGKKVALVGESHLETKHEEEEAYFKKFGVGYHTEISSWKQEFKENEDKSLDILIDENSFSAENVPVRTLGDAYGYDDEMEEFEKEYIKPMVDHHADVYKGVEKLLKWKNQRLIDTGKENLETDRAAFFKFIVESLEIRNSHLSLHSGIFEGMAGTVKALKETPYAEKAKVIDDYLKLAQEKLEKHSYWIFKIIAEISESVQKAIAEPDTEKMKKELAKTFKELERFEQKVILPIVSFQSEMVSLLPEMIAFLKMVLGKQNPIAHPLNGSGLDNGKQVFKSRSGAMLDNAIALSNKTSKTEVVKVGQLHIDDIQEVKEDALAGAGDLAILNKTTYYDLQDTTGTAALRENNED